MICFSPFSPSIGRLPNWPYLIRLLALISFQVGRPSPSVSASFSTSSTSRSMACVCGLAVDRELELDDQRIARGQKQRFARWRNVGGAAGRGLLVRSRPARSRRARLSTGSAGGSVGRLGRQRLDGFDRQRPLSRGVWRAPAPCWCRSPPSSRLSETNSDASSQPAITQQTFDQNHHHSSLRMAAAPALRRTGPESCPHCIRYNRRQSVPRTVAERRRPRDDVLVAGAELASSATFQQSDPDADLYSPSPSSSSPQNDSPWACLHDAFISRFPSSARSIGWPMRPASPAACAWPLGSSAARRPSTCCPAAVAIIVHYLVAELAGMYRSWRGVSGDREAFATLCTWLVAFSLLAALGFATGRLAEFPRLLLGVWLLGTAAVPGPRARPAARGSSGRCGCAG